MITLKLSEFRKVWQDPTHAEFFDSWSKLSLKELRKTYESFNEIRLFIEHQSSIQRAVFVEVGCATGELYRYVNRFHPRFKYYGFDISEPAIHRAKQKYPGGRFFIGKEDLSNIADYCHPPPSVLFARDVITNHPAPFDVLARLVSIPTEAAILRIRTRDKGKTVLDPELSCQWLYQTWVPYMILNIDEVIEEIKKACNFSALYIVKNYQQLGGRNDRYLPKDCYYPETGTAQAAVYIQLVKDKIALPRIVIESRAELKPHYTLLERGWRVMRREILKRLERP